MSHPSYTFGTAYVWIY